jgi:hypothetical protein
MPKELKDFASAIIATLLTAAAITFLSLFAGPPAYGQNKPPVGDMLYAMVEIRQPLAITDDMFDRYRVGGDLYATSERCMVAARQSMLKNAAEMAAGKAEFRVFSGCITIPAPGKTPNLPAAHDPKAPLI